MNANAYLPRLLIVEDECLILESLEGSFKSLQLPFRKRYGIPGFEVDGAKTADEAQKRLNDAIAQRRPYDIMWLDLGLPKTASDTVRNNPEVGIRFLRENLGTGAYEAVIVATAHGDKPEILRSLLRTRAVDDFIEKASEEWDVENEGPQRLVTEAYKRVQERRRQRIVRDWAEHRCRRARLYLADHMMRIVAEGVSCLLTKVRTLQELLRDRIGQTAEGPCGGVWEILDQLYVGAENIARDCRAVQDVCYTDSRGFGQWDIGEIVLREIERLQPVWEGKWKVDHEGVKKVAVHTFLEDIRRIVEELLLGTMEHAKEDLADPPHDPLTLTLFVCPSEDSLTVDVGVEDTGDHQFAEDDLDAIERGDFDGSPSRASGLALAQRMAHNIGAHIHVKPLQLGNRVILHIPVTAND